MSRAYRIRVKESLSRILRASDHVSTQLEILEILPPEEMAGLLSDQLKGRGFEEEDGKLIRRREDGITITVDASSGTVSVESESSEDVELKGERGGYIYDDEGPSRGEAQEQLRKELKQDLEKQAAKRSEQLQKVATEKLEQELLGLRKELDEAVNRVTAEALKRKAAQIGRIKEMNEDPEGESLTIVVEV